MADADPYKPDDYIKESEQKKAEQDALKKKQEKVKAGFANMDAPPAKSACATCAAKEAQDKLQDQAKQMALDTAPAKQAKEKIVEPIAKAGAKALDAVAGAAFGAVGLGAWYQGQSSGKTDVDVGLGTATITYTPDP